MEKYHILVHKYFFLFFLFPPFPCGMTTEMCLTSLILKRRACDPKMWITRSYLLTWFYYISMDEWFSGHEPTERKEGSGKTSNSKNILTIRVLFLQS